MRSRHWNAGNLSQAIRYAACIFLNCASNVQVRQRVATNTRLQGATTQVLAVTAPREVCLRNTGQAIEDMLFEVLT